MIIGTVIKSILSTKNMSVYRLSKNSNISKSYLSSMINGKYKNPALDVILRLSKGLGVPISTLLEDVTTEEESSP